MLASTLHVGPAMTVRPEIAPIVQDARSAAEEIVSGILTPVLDAIRRWEPSEESVEVFPWAADTNALARSEEHTSELQSH